MGKTPIVRGFKCFNMDLTCHGYQFEIGKTYEHDGEVKLCSSGFHFHQNFEDHNAFYSGRKRMCEIEAEGVVTGSNNAVAKKITLTRELGWREFGSGYVADCITGYDTGNGNEGYGNGGGSGNGNGDGDGDGSGKGHGTGHGDGHGDGNGTGQGHGCPEMSFPD